MPVFYFHLIDDGHRSADADGTAFASFELAYLDAFRAVQDMAWEMIQRGRDPRRCSFEIADASHVSLAHLPFAEVLDQTLNPIFQTDPRTASPCADRGGAAAHDASPGPAVDTRRSAALAPRPWLDAGRIHFDVGEPLAD
ncbi:MAG: hypothetical protein IT534_14160 [Bauldia sp.]|jgi:hypothetical protein|nr:hypothetical protein [Bauldia sp.]